MSAQLQIIAYIKPPLKIARLNAVSVITTCSSAFRFSHNLYELEFSFCGIMRSKLAKYFLRVHTYNIKIWREML